jgi:hypothetical protein
MTQRTSTPVDRRVSWRLSHRPHDHRRVFGYLRWIEKPVEGERQFHVTSTAGTEHVIPARFITYED